MAAIAYTPAQIRPLEGAVIRDFSAGGSGELGNAVYIASDGDVEQVDANVAVTSEFEGIVVGVGEGGETTFAAGDRLSVVTFGPVGGFSGMTPGGRVYVDTDTGKLDHTAPTGAGTWTKVAGYAESASVLFVMPQAAAPSSNS